MVSARCCYFWQYVQCYCCHCCSFGSVMLHKCCSCLRVFIKLLVNYQSLCDIQLCEEKKKQESKTVRYSTRYLVCFLRTTGCTSIPVIILPGVLFVFGRFYLILRIPVSTQVPWSRTTTGAPGTPGKVMTRKHLRTTAVLYMVIPQCVWCVPSLRHADRFSMHNHYR